MQPGATFCVHGIALRVTCESPDISDAIARRLDVFLAHPARDETVTVTITGPGARSIVDHADISRARTVYEGPDGDMSYLDGEDRLLADYDGRVEIDVNGRAGSARIAVTGTRPADEMLAAYPFFSIALLELMKRRQRFGLHAACVGRAGRGLLFPGPSGSGKSTLAAVLTRAGMDFLADDTVFLEPEAEEVLAFPDELDLSDDTIDMIAGLPTRRAQPKRAGRPKHALAAHELRGGETVLRAAPSRLIFPSIHDVRRSTLTPLDADSAFRMLAPNVLLTDLAASQAHLDTLGRLARTVPAMRLEIGAELDEIVALVEPMTT